MSVQTLNDLQDALDEGLAWRRIELHAMSGEIERAERRSATSPLARALARSGLAILYAHWEGYTKDACQSYVDFVTRRRLRIGELSDGLALSAVRDLIKREQNGDDLAKSHILEALRRPQNARARIPRKTAVNTKSNLRYEVLIEILELVDVPYSTIATKQKLIDASLCDARNGIAHGRYVVLNLGEFEALRIEILEMLEWLRDQLLLNARSKLYSVPLP
jgi:hypothetical protein